MNESSRPNRKLSGIILRARNIISGMDFSTLLDRILLPLRFLHLLSFREIAIQVWRTLGGGRMSLTNHFEESCRF
jgi:hypothetical protein